MFDFRIFTIQTHRTKLNTYSQPNCPLLTPTSNAENVSIWWRHCALVKQAVIDSDNGVWPVRCQAIIWTKADLIWFDLIWTPKNKLKWHLNQNMTILSQDNEFENVFAKWRTFCLGLSQCVNRDIYYNDDHQLRGSIYVFDEKCDIQRIPWSKVLLHYNDVIVGAMAYRITSLTTVYSTVYSDADKRNTKAPRHWPLCENSLGTGEFHAQMASNAENVSIWWRHHDYLLWAIYHSEWLKGLLWHPKWCECLIIHWAHTHTHIYIYIMKKCVKSTPSLTHLSNTFYQCSTHSSTHDAFMKVSMTCCSEGLVVKALVFRMYVAMI